MFSMYLRSRSRATRRAARPFLPAGGHRAVRFVVCAVVCGLLVSAACRHADAQGGTPVRYDQGDPSDAEQYLLCTLNRARLDPTAEGQRLAAWLRTDSFGQSIIAQYGLKLTQVAAEFAALPAVPPLAFNANLLSAVRTHSAELAAHGGLGPGGSLHAGLDGSTPQSRDLAAGYTQGFGGENAAAGYPAFPSLDEPHAGYLVDWGVADLGHRRNCMDGSFGQACLPMIKTPRRCCTPQWQPRRSRAPA